MPPFSAVTPLDGAVRVDLPELAPGAPPPTSFELTPVFGRTVLPERTVTVGGSETHALVRGLRNDVTYRVRVIALFAEGPGPAFLSDPFTPTGGPQSAMGQTERVAAAAPTGVMAVAGEQSATVTWSPPVGGGPLEGYRVIATPPHVDPIEVPVGQKSVFVTGLHNRSRYTFTVVAVSAEGEDFSSPSNSIRVGRPRIWRRSRRLAPTPQPARRLIKTIPYDKSVWWYLITVLVVTIPIALNWVVLKVAKLDAATWELIGRGELLLIGVPLAVLALAALHTRELTRAAEPTGARAVLSVALGVVLAAQVALYGAATIANHTKEGSDRDFFLGVSYALYIPTVMIGTAGVWITRKDTSMPGDSSESPP